MNSQAFISRRVVTPEGIRPAAILVEGEQIQAHCSYRDKFRPTARCTISAMPRFFPGWWILTFTSTSPDEPSGKAFSTATRAAAAGGYTLLVDMPLNCLPATTTVAALEAKRAAAQGKCRVDWAAWGGVVRDNQEDIEALAAAGVRGSSAF